MKSKFQSIVNILRNEANEFATDGGGATDSTVEAAVELTEGPLMVPTSYVRLEEAQDITATVVSIDPKVNAGGKPYLSLVFQMDNGRTSHKMWINTPASVANTKRQLGRAFGIESFKDIQNAVGQKCSLSARFDDFAQRVTVSFVNKFNEHANDVVDLDALDAMAAEVPATAEIQDVMF